MTAPTGAAAQSEGDEFDALRQQVRDIKQEERCSNATVARLAGIGESTLQAFMAGAYAGRNDQVVAKLHAWLEARQAELRVRTGAAASNLFTMTATAETFIAAMEHAQFLPDLVVLTGGAGVGKTSSAKHYVATRPNVWMITASPAVKTSFSMLERLSEAMMVREYSPTARAREIVRRLRGSKALIMVDEAQHLVTQAVEQLRSFHDEAGIGLALLGNPTVWSRIDGGGRRSEFAQLFSRVGLRVTRQRPLAEDVAAVLNAHGVQDSEARKLLRAIATKPGALRGMVKVLRAAHLRAVGAGDEEEAEKAPPSLSAAHVREAWRLLSDGTPLDMASSA